MGNRQEKEYRFANVIINTLIPSRPTGAVLRGVAPD